MATRTTTNTATTNLIANNPFLAALGTSLVPNTFEIWDSFALTYTLNAGDSNPDGELVGTWTASLSNAIEMALADIAAVSGLSFTEVADTVNGSDGADIDFWYYNNANDNSSGYSYGVGGDGVYIDEESVYDGTGGAADGLVYGGINYRTVVHELLHNMGLGHPHEGFASLPGVNSSNDTGSFALNQNLYTQMSYNRVGQVDDNGEQTTGYPFTLNTVDRSFSVMGAFDIAYLQALYGANMSEATGNDVYMLPQGNVSGTHFKTIWDAGGTDEIRYAGAGKTRIDLRDATLDLSDGMLAGGALSRAFGVFGGYTIAQGTVIENATGGTGNDEIIGNDADNLLKGSSGYDMIQGGNGRDTIFGGGNADTLSGGAGSDKIEGGKGPDELAGGGGDDWLYYTTSSGAVSVNLGVAVQAGGDAAGDIISEFEWVLGSVNDDTLIGNSGANVLFGGAGNDTIKGAGGNDQIMGGLGADDLNGQAGADWVSYRTSNVGVSIDLGSGAASGGHANGDTITAFERILGSNHGDDLTGDGGANMIYGRGGRDTMIGGGGNDVLRGGTGGDDLDGGAGIDILDYSGSRNAVNVDLSVNTASGGDAQGDTIAGFEKVIGTRGDDTLTGDNGNNYLRGNLGADELNGGRGSDVLRGGAGSDTLDGMGGQDWADYRGSSAVIVNLGTLAVSGGDAAGDVLISIERVFGSSFNDVLTGNGAVNILDGGAGRDTLDGGGGDDILRGKAGADVFLFDAGSDQIEGGSGFDRAFFDGLLAEFNVVDLSGGNWEVTHIATGDLDQLSSIEELEFNDTILT